MPKEFKRLLGNRLYLEIPEEPKSAVILDDESKAALEIEKTKKYGRLKVYAVGDTITHIEEGDEIMIDPSSVANVIRIPLSEDRVVMMISIFQVAHIW